MLCKDNEYQFLVRMTKAREQNRSRKQIIAEEIAKYVEEVPIEIDSEDADESWRLKKRIKKGDRLIIFNKNVALIKMTTLRFYFEY